MMPLTEGDRLPDFDLRDDRDQPTTADDLRRGTVVLYVYPKDETPGCTRQACGFRDGLDAFTERGARVYGVSPDDVDSHRRFREKYRLNFPLLADPDGALCRALGAWGEQRYGEHRWMGAARTTFVLREGVVMTVFEDVDVTAHTERVLAALPR